MAQKKEIKLNEILQDIFDAEHFTSKCFGHLAALVNNGNIRDKFSYFSERAERNKEELEQWLDNLGETNFCAREHCTFCQVEPGSFSLLGALNVGLEVTEITLKRYKQLVALKEQAHNKNLYKKLFKEKTEQKRFLKQEKKFIKEHEDKPTFADDYCIPEIISKYWK